MNIRVRSISLRRQKRRIFWMAAATVIAISCISAALIMVRFNHAAHAATPADSCFSFNAVTETVEGYYTYEDNNSENPSCPLIVDVPASIGGVPVTIIGSGAFAGSGVTSLQLPGSITDIQAGAVDGLTLSQLIINSTGDLTLWQSSIQGATIASNDLSIHADGDVSILNSLAGLVLPGNLSISAGGDVTIAQGSLSGSVTQSVHISAGGFIISTDGAFSGSSAEDLTATAGGALTIIRGAFSALSGHIVLNGGEDVTIAEGAFADEGISADLSIHSDSSVIINGAITNNHITTAEIVAGQAVQIISSAMNTSPDLESLSLTSQNDSVEVSGGTFMIVDALEHLSISAPKNVVVDQSFYDTSPSLVVAFTVGGNVTLTQNAFINGQFPSLVIATNGSIEISNGAFSGVGFIRNLNLQAGQDITLSGVFNTWDTLNTETVSLKAGGDLAVDDYSFQEGYGIRSLQLEANGVTSFGNDTFRSIKVPTLSLPAGTVEIGAGAFQYSTLESVYLNGSTPTIGVDVFRFAGITREAGATPSDLDNVHYVQLYTDANALNIGGYAHTHYEPYDLTGDGPALSGGYIVNPAMYAVQYRSTDGDTLAADTQSGAGEGLSDYRVVRNPTGDFSKYYQANDTVTILPIAITGYVAPSNLTETLLPGANVYTLAYTALTVGVPNTGIAGMSSKGVSIWAFVGAGIAAIITGFALVYGIRQQQ